ncbi:hypothetical protein Tco_1377000 [Tanacetum coccineum]
MSWDLFLRFLHRRTTYLALDGNTSPDYLCLAEVPAEQGTTFIFTYSFVPEACLRRSLPVDDEGIYAVDPEEDLEEDDEEDPEVDPTDICYRGDDDDDDAEEEHLAPADPAAVAYSADQDPYIAYRVTARMSIRPLAAWPPFPL